MPMRGRLFRKYAAYFAGVVTLGVLTSGLVSLAFSYRDTRLLMNALHLEKARVAATSIEQYLRTIESHLRAALLAHTVTREDAALDEQHQELIKLLRINSAVIEAAWVDAAGTERLRLSRIAPDVLRGTRDRSADPMIIAAGAGKTTFGTVYFRQQTEPYLSVAVAGDEPQAGIVVAEINLKFVWDVVSTLHVGASGYAYVIDGQGRLISHPDISLVLKQTDLSALPQVRALMSKPESGADTVLISATAADGKARPSLSAWMPVPAPGWFVYVEQPLTEAFAPLYASIARTALVLIASLAFCIALSVALARHMTTPIRALQIGAARIGEGKLDERVSITTGDELETLAHEFNTMAQRLHESRSGLEQKIEDRTRALAEANNAKSRFLAVASHDLRQPVHALGLFVAQAKEARGDLMRESLIGRIESSWQSISGLLDALLDISKLDSNTLQVNATHFAAQSVLDRIEQSFAVLAAAKGLRMRVRPSRLLLASDVLLVERILLNLVSNALRYTREGGVLIGVRRRYPGSHARIDVWDTGAGIAQEESRHIFDEFYRGHAGSLESAGMGLGLAIVRRIAQLLEVAVTVRSTPGKGSLFSITVPLAPAGSTVDVPAPREIPQSRFAGGLALIIDDDANARDAASGLLRQWGWDVISAGSIQGALGALTRDSRTPDVIVSDYHLTDENGHDHESGVDAIARIRAARAQEIPAVLVSGDVTAELRAHAARESLHLLHKPLQAAKLRAMLHHLHAADIVR
ncbi:MAG: ATPase [Betaproteobacteria bacterium]|nr:ATPase [Betaproteobacteria bacterium]